jgi:hypothetical protein
MTTRDMTMMQQRGTMSFLGEAMTMIWTGAVAGPMD